MSTSAYLSTYGVNCQSSDCTVTFLIPDNCTFTLSQDSESTHLIIVELGPDEKDPSTIFESVNTTFNYEVNGELSIAFVLPDVTITIPDENPHLPVKKPRIIISSLKQ